MKRLIITLIRKRLGLNKYERFRFSNQKKPGVYYFTEDMLMKDEHGLITPAGVSVNWLLDECCEYERV